MHKAVTRSLRAALAVGFLLLAPGGDVQVARAQLELLPSSLNAIPLFGKTGQIKGYYCADPCTQYSPTCCYIFGPN